MSTMCSFQSRRPLYDACMGERVEFRDAARVRRGVAPEGVGAARTLGTNGPEHRCAPKVRRGGASADGSRCARWGVTSWIEPTSRPAAWSERIAVSRPEPGPLTKTSTLRMPCSCAGGRPTRRPCCAANGVDLREPLKPTSPAEAQEITAPARVGDRDDGVVERALDVRLAESDVLLFLAAHLLGSALTTLGGHLNLLREVVGPTAQDR